jgi:hypothetical protein
MRIEEIFRPEHGRLRGDIDGEVFRPGMSIASRSVRLRSERRKPCTLRASQPQR